MAQPDGPWWSLLDALAQARKQQGRKPASLSREINASLNGVATWESGGVTPNAKMFIRWANALGYDVKLVKR